MDEVKRKIKISAVGLILAAGAVISEVSALAVMWQGTGELLFIALFALAGFLSHYACRKLCCPSIIGLALLCVLLLILYPFTVGVGGWWIGVGVMGFYFAVFFAIIMLLGWSVGVIPSMISDSLKKKENSSRTFDVVRYTVLLLVVLAVLGWLFDLCFGNPITAYIAGDEMREWINEQETEYEIRTDSTLHLPRYDWYGTEYIFELAGDGSRWVLHWNDGKIRLDSGNW